MLMHSVKVKIKVKVTRSNLLLPSCVALRVCIRDPLREILRPWGSTP